MAYKPEDDLARGTTRTTLEIFNEEQNEELIENEEQKFQTPIQDMQEPESARVCFSFRGLKKTSGSRCSGISERGRQRCSRASRAARARGGARRRWRVGCAGGPYGPRPVLSCYAYFRVPNILNSICHILLIIENEEAPHSQFVCST